MGGDAIGAQGARMLTAGGQVALPNASVAVPPSRRDEMVAQGAAASGRRTSPPRLQRPPRCRSSRRLRRSRRRCALIAALCSSAAATRRAGGVAEAVHERRGAKQHAAPLGGQRDRRPRRVLLWIVACDGEAPSLLRASPRSRRCSRTSRSTSACSRRHRDPRVERARRDAQAIGDASRARHAPCSTYVSDSGERSFRAIGVTARDLAALPRATSRRSKTSASSCSRPSEARASVAVLARRSCEAFSRGRASPRVPRS